MVPARSVPGVHYQLCATGLKNFQSGNREIVGKRLTYAESHRQGGRDRNDQLSHGAANAAQNQNGSLCYARPQWNAHRAATPNRGITDFAHVVSTLSKGRSLIYCCI